MDPTTRRRLLLGGVAGPAAFASAWIWGSATTDGYSPVDDPISRLAAQGAETQPVMTAGLLAFAAGVGLYAAALRDELPGAAWVAAAVTASASVGIAATPLDSPLGGAPHGAAAATAYVSLAMVPGLAARVLSQRGQRRRAAASRATAAVTLACLAASIAGPDSTNGLFQRIGLSAGHLWIAASAVGLRGGDRAR